MATRAENIETRLDAIALELAEMGPTKAGGLPDASGMPVGVGHVAYRMSLIAEMRELNEELKEIIRQQDGAFEVTSEMTA